MKLEELWRDLGGARLALRLERLEVGTDQILRS